MVRLGLIQAALGSVVVLTTSTINRVMVVEYSLPTILPGLLIAWHYAVQLLRPRLGYEADVTRSPIPWILGGMAVLGGGGVLCSYAAVRIAGHPASGLILAAAGYTLVGLGVGAAGTSLLVLLTKQVEPHRRAAAATIMWTMMIAGFAVTSATVGHYLDPFSPARMLTATLAVALAAMTVTLCAVWKVQRRVEPDNRVRPTKRDPNAAATFKSSLRRVWAEPQACRFTLFVFASMLAYSAQELLLEPFAGLVFGATLGQSARLSGLWHGSALLGMVGVGLVCSRARVRTLRGCTLFGCYASSVALASLALAGVVGPAWPLRWSLVALGIANGIFAVSAIGAMMEAARAGSAGEAGVRLGLWGAAQAVAFACGGVFATLLLDAMRFLFGSSASAFAVVFTIEALLFFAAAQFVVPAGRDAIQDKSLTIEAAST